MDQENKQLAAIIERTEAGLPSTIPLESRPPPDLAMICRTIEHTLLAPDATSQQIDTLCFDAVQYDFVGVCIRAEWVSRVARNLRGFPIKIVCVIGFPEGTQSTADKVSEAIQAVADGATELDMVINYVWLKEGRFAEVLEEIRAVRNAAINRVGLKVILETSQLNRGEIIAGCVLSVLAGANYVKTSTGFNGPGATPENVAVMRAVCDSMEGHVRVKASGGIKTAQACKKMIQAGASRIGASSGVEIMDGITARAR